MSVQQQSPVRFGNCILEEKIGEGGMGVVFRGKQLPMMRDVVVKLISPRNVHPGSVTSFQEEVIRLSHLHHPHILTVYDAGVQGGVPYVVMQYLDGGDVEQRIIRHGPLEVQEAITIAVEVASALNFAHEHGFVHRDVKPPNVLLARHPFRAVLADFGLATVAGPQRMSQRGAGTEGFMAPEQYQGGPFDARTDVYGLAATLYWMLAGSPPVVAPASSAKGKAIALPNVGPNVPTTAADAIRRGLSVDPAERHASAKEFADDVSQDVEIPPLVWVAAGAALFAVGKGAFDLYQRRRARKRLREAGVVDAEVVETTSVVSPPGAVVCTHCGRIPRDRTRETCSQCQRPLPHMDGKVPVSALDD